MKLSAGIDRPPAGAGKQSRLGYGIERITFYGGTVLLCLFFLLPYPLLFLAGLSLILISAAVGRAPLITLVIFALTFRGIGLGGSARASLFNLYDPFIILFVVLAVLPLIRRSVLRPALLMKTILACGVFLGALLPQFLVTVDMSRSLVEFSRYIINILFLIGFVVYIGRDKSLLLTIVYRLQDVLFFSIVLAYADGLSQWLTPFRTSSVSWSILSISIPNWVQEARGGFVRVSGYWNDPDHLGAFIITALILIIYMPGLRQRWPKSVLVIAAGGAIVLTKSLSLLIIFSGVVSLLLWQGLAARLRSKAALIAISFFAASAGVIVAIFLLNGWISVPGVTSIAGRPTDHLGRSIGNRFFFWERAVDFFMEKPLIGSGLDSFRILIRNERNWVNLPPPHNSFLQLIVGAGLVGLAGFAVLAAHIAQRARQAYRHGFPGFVLALLISMVFSLGFEYFTARVFWLTIGFVVSGALVHHMDVRYTPP